ncbi:McrB family protein [Helicobacter sp. MIT 11-5569]|uniref:McrB family protein n=1 Tax=Helicobacter sp. MIT 11-5569 TaxID=1548151 RepID=UPI001F3F3E2E|nr:AAA family ATPase [Helicobacter sp. MIT 11-5569]
MTDEEPRELFKELQKHWDLEKVKNMTLEQYTGIKEEGNDRDDFTYWIESKLDKLGSIWGGSAFKFGIYKRKNQEEKEDNNTYSYNATYGWLKKLGENPKDAFEKTKAIILKIIELSQKNELDEIDKIKDLGEAYKWKIAFHYQNVNDIRIMCIFKEDVLQKIAKGENLGENLSTAQIHQKLLGDKTKPYTLEKMLNEKYIPLWEKYGKNDKEQDIQKLNEDSNQNNLRDSKIPLNQILYGPPGTGKTYHAIDKALEILGFTKDNNINKNNKVSLDYDKIKKELEKLNIKLDKDNERVYAKTLFEYFKDKGQIAFITFHQSFSYEEFVEGIKPIVDDSQNMTYEVKNGIFKELCKKALKNYEDSNKSQETIQKESNISNAVSDFFNNLISKETLLAKTQRGSFSIKEINNERIYIQSEDTTQNLKFPITDFEKIVLADKNFKSSRELAFEVFGEKNQSQIRTYQYQLYNEFKKGNFQKSQPQEKEAEIELKPYILIIDEINRGNISKILGELITLIETSKRIGNNEELKVTLPYSQESFGVSNNLYIIGTMNTADRSIALLDTALRRRFEFIEMMPKSSVLSTDCVGVNLQQLLESINNRIEFLLDREHTIGHAYFINAKTLEDLKTIFAKKIIPLFQEYFYEDYAKINAVLNDNEMIKVKDSKFDKLFNTKFNEFDNEKVIYEITNKWKVENFQKIYDSSVKLDTQNNEN